MALSAEPVSGEGAKVKEQGRRPPFRAFTATVFLSLLAVSFATAIFAIDTFTPLGLAVAVLYVVVVLMAGRFLDRRGVFLVAVACLILTITSFLLQHGLTYGPSLARCLVSLLAIAITTFLALKSQAAALTLREQASLLDITHDAIIARDLNDVITYWNRGAEQLYGWSREEALGKTPHELLRTVFPVPLEEIKSTLLSTGRWEGELVHRKRDGTEVVAASRWSVQRDAARRPAAILETNNDITERKRAEAKTKRQEKELQLTIDTIPAFVFRILPDGWTDFLNKRWLDYTGLTHSEAEGLGWRVVYHPDDIDQIVETCNKGIASGEPWESEGRIRSADGQYRWFLNRAAPLRDEHGNIVKWYGSNTDIEDRKRAEAKTKQQERELQLTVDSIPTLVWQTGPDGDAQYLSKQWLNYTGMSQEQALGWGWTDSIHPDDLSGLLIAWELIRGAGVSAETEARFRRSDGEFRWCLFRCEPLRDEAGRVIKWYGANTDIEDRKRAENALRRSEAYLAEAQRLSLTGSFGWTIGTGEIQWSAEAFRIFERDPKIPPTLDFVVERTHPDDRGFLKRLLERVSRNRDNWEVEHRLLMPDGSIKHIHVVAHPLGEASGPLEYVGALMDITAEKHAQEALQQAQAELAHVTRVTTLGELTASIAHEVNQPLAAIITNGEACLRWLGNETPNLEEARNAVERLIRDGNRAGEVIQRLRALTKKTDPQNAPIDINDVIHDVVGLVQREVLSHRVRLRLELDSGLDPILGDRVQLQQVIINLIVNGIEAMANVADRRELMIRVREHDRDHAMVAVQDTGVGIPPDQLDRVFNAFFTTKADGMGMGLSICRSIVEGHGGRLWASRNEGAGVTFQFTVPFVGAL
jgi:PAS domain S-box-containing protein